MANTKSRSKGTGSLYKRGKVYQYRYFVDGKRIQVSTGCTDKEKAEEWVNKHHSAVNEIKKATDFYQKIAETKKLINKEQLTLRSALEKYKKDLSIEDLQDDTRNRHYRRAELFIEYLEEIVPPLKYVWEVNDQIAIDYSKHLKAKNLTSNTFNSNIFSLHKFFEHFKSETGTVDNPFRSNKKDKNIKLKRVMTVQKDGFTEEQVIQIITSLESLQVRDREEYRLLFILGAYTGARLKDCALMKWESINLDANLIKYIPYKTSRFGTVAIVPILPELKAELLKLQIINEYVFPVIAQKYNKGRKYVIVDNKRILKLNGFDNNNTDVKTNRVKSAVKYGFHGLRYFFVTQCARKRIPLKLVKEAVGHSDDIMTEYYTVLSILDRQKAFGLTGDAPILEQITELLPIAKHETLKEILGLLKLDAGLIKRVDKPAARLKTNNLLS